VSDAAIDRLADGADPVGLAGGRELSGGVEPATGARLCALDLAAEPGGCTVVDRAG